MANLALPRNFQLNEYKISRKLSSGGFSIVYLAYTKHGMPVAIKEFFPNNLHLRSKGQSVDFINSRERSRFLSGLRAFKDETEIVMRLKHKNIIEIIDFFEMNGTAYIVMPYEYGCTLSKFIALEKNLQETEIVNIITGIFEAVHMFHENGIIHLDLKPGNIWLRPNKDALILDFGTARILNDEEKKKEPPMYTPGYAAPEQHKELFQPARIGVWTDYYGLGATLYAMIEKKSAPPSPDYILNGTKVDIKNERLGQFNTLLLEIIEYLMTPEWDKRKKINLLDVIDRMKKIKSHTPPSTFLSHFDELQLESFSIFKNSLNQSPIIFEK